MNVLSQNGTPTTNVRYAFFIAGGIIAFHTMTLVATFLVGDRTFFKKTGYQEIQGESTMIERGKQNRGFLITFVSLIFVFYWMYVMAEVAYFTYLTTYVVDELNWTKASGAALTSAFWISFTLGRGVGVFLVKCVDAAKQISIMVVGTVVSLVVELFFAHIHPSIMWAGTVCFGLSVSTIYASGLTFANRYINCSGGLAAVFMAAGSLGGLGGPILIVPLFDTFGMKVFMVLEVASSVILFVVFCCAWYLGRKQGPRSGTWTERSTENAGLLRA